MKAVVRHGIYTGRMTAPVKVLFLMEDLCYGGTQRQSLELAGRLDRGLFSVDMLTLTGPTDLDDVALDHGIGLRHLGVSRRVPPLFFLRLPGMLRRLLPDILVTCTALPNIWGRLWGRALRAPVIVGTCRGGGGPKRQHERWLWRMADHIVCNSPALLQALSGVGVPENRLTCIANGVDTERFKPAAPPPSGREAMLLCVARLAGDKDILTLLRAFELIWQKKPATRLRIVGDGPEYAVLKRWAREHTAGSQVTFCPGVHDIRSHYAAARIFALSSVREGQPNVILEAMSCGLPVCATAVGGIPDLVADGITGFLSPAGDAAAFAENCLRLLDDPSLGDRLGRNGRQRMERDFSFASMVGSHERLFERLLAERGQRGAMRAKGA